MLLFKGLIDCLFMLLITLMVMPIKLKETVIENIFFPRVDITNYNVLIDDRKFYDQPIINQIKQYDKIRKISTGKIDDYTTGCLLDHQYFKDHYQLIAVDLSKQKEIRC